MSLEPHLLIIKPPNTPFMIEVDGPNGPTRRISRDCWKQHDGVLRIGMPTEQPEVIQICGFFNASFGQSVGLFRELREPVRLAERRVGQGCVSTCRSWWL